VVTAVVDRSAPGVVAARRHDLQARLRAARKRHEWLDHLLRAGERYVAQRGNHFAAAITFFSVLTAVPLLMVAFAAAGYVLWFHPALLAQLERSVATAVPGGLSEALDPILDTAIAQRNTVAGVGLAAALWSGIWWMSNLREAVSAQWGLPAPHPAALQRLLHDLVALVGLGAALLTSLAVTAVGSGLTATVLDLVGLADDGVNRALLQTSAVVIGLAANWLIFLWAITRLPRTDVPMRGAARAALLGAVALEILKQGTAIYLDRVTTSASGAVFGSLLGLLLFSYVVARLVLLVTAWAATAPGNERPTPVPPPVPAVLTHVVVRSERPAATVGAVGAAVMTGVLIGAWLRCTAQRSVRGRKGT
jgi:membrane protein